MVAALVIPKRYVSIKYQIIAHPFNGHLAMNAAHRECLVQGLPFVSMAMTSLTETFGEYIIYSSHQLELSLRRQLSKPFFVAAMAFFCLKYIGRFSVL